MTACDAMGTASAHAALTRFQMRARAVPNLHVDGANHQSFLFAIKQYKFIRLLALLSVSVCHCWHYG